MRNAAASGATCAVKFGSKKNGTLQGQGSSISDHLVDDDGDFFSCARGGYADRRKG